MGNPSLMEKPIFGLMPAQTIQGFESIRSQAWKMVSDFGFPHHSDEEYKYTSLRHLQELTWTAGTAIRLQPSQIENLGITGFEQVRLVFVNGFFASDLSDELPDGIEFRTLDSGDMPTLLGKAARVDAQEFPVTAHLGRLQKPGIPVTTALNTAAFQSGAYIKVQKDAVIELPIQLLFVTTGAAVATTPRILIEVEPSAKATLIESYATTGEANHLTVPVTEIFVAQNATLEHVKVQLESLEAEHIALTEISQQRDSTVRHFNVTYGGRLTRNDLNVFLHGSGTHLRMDGVVCIDGSQHVDNHTRLDHAHPNCESFEIYKHLLDGKSTAVFNGKIFVHEDAQKTDAKQTNQAILLSPEATMNTKPQLEIFADDVKCTHGATIGQIREDAMFYLRSRGISVQEARALMVYAFAAEVLEQIEHEGIRQQLEQKLFNKLNPS